MQKNLKNIALILAAGSGSRFGSKQPKQFSLLAGKPIIQHTLEAFQQNLQIDEICLVADPIYHNQLQQLAIDNKITKVKKIIAGGKERQDSSYQAIQAYQYLTEANLLIHDAARPLVSQRIINACIEALADYQAVNTAIPVTDTLIQVGEDARFIGQQLDRSQLRRSQTPQAFKLSSILQAHKLAQADNNPPAFTDDCGLIHQYLSTTPIYLIEGEERNLKITYQEDLQLAESLLRN